jgi:hypothetical protein
VCGTWIQDPSQEVRIGRLDSVDVEDFEGIRVAMSSLQQTVELLELPLQGRQAVQNRLRSVWHERCVPSRFRYCQTRP